MHLRYFTPAPALRPYVRSYYLLEGDFGGGTDDVFFADGCPELVFNVGVDFYRDGVREAWAKVIGQITHPLHVTATGRGSSFGIWFRPQGLAAFTGLAADELTDTAVAAEQLFGPELQQLVGEGLAAGDEARTVPRVDAALVALLRPAGGGRGEELVRFAVRRLTDHPADEKIEAVAKACQVSPRHLQQLFRERVGLRPKQFQRVTRFQRSIGAVTAAGSGALTDAAYGSGYFDQAHFIREFKRFTGLTPSKYRAQERLIGRHF